MTARLAVFRTFLFLALLMLLGRLAFLQGARGGYYRSLAEQNRMRLVPEQAPRGLILDRQGKIMATNQTIFRVAVIPQDVKNMDALLSEVGAIVGRPVVELQKRLKKEQTFVFVPATIVPTVPKEVALRLEEARWRLPGLFVRTETVRHYPLGQTGAHVMGYLSQPTAEELPMLKRYGVRPRTLVGRSGVERMMDYLLRGEPGGLMVEVNHRGRQVGIMSQRQSQAGEPVMLTIDSGLQSLLEQAFAEQAGAAAVIDPNTGEVLALASNPGFPPEAFAISDSDAVSELLADPLRRLVNRATYDTYPPGSIAKLVVGLAALEQEVVTPETVVHCNGAMTIGDRTFHCWNRDGHGPITMASAIMQSCNVYFMQLGRWLGPARLRTAYAKVGFGQDTHWPLEERPGQLPTKRLTEGEVAIFAIGQGVFEVTALQAAMMAGIFANGGWLVQPNLIKTVGNRPGADHAVRQRVCWDDNTLAVIRTGMAAVIRDPRGTGHRAMTPDITIAGKTGTAQTHKKGETHAWFVGYCPVERPRAAVAVVAEFGGSGGDIPTGIARTVCEYIAVLDQTAREAQQSESQEAGE